MSNAIIIVAVLAVLVWGSFTSYRNGSSRQREKQLEQTLKSVLAAKKSSEHTARMPVDERIERMRQRSPE